MAEWESIFSKLVLSLQLCLAFWQVVKFTAIAEWIKAFVSRGASMLPCSLFSSHFSRLKGLEGGAFIIKTGHCFVTKETDEGNVAIQVSIETVIEIDYLGRKFHLERKERHKLFVNGKMTYYITDSIWHALLDLKIVDNKTVFLKGPKRLFKAGPFTGGVMDLSEVLDCLILRNHVIKPLLVGVQSRFIPINLSISEEKILKSLNILGLFLQTKKHVHWLVPALLSLTSAVLEFCTPLRVWIYTKVSHTFCWVMHPLCDRLPMQARIWIYSMLGWVENLEPSNDVEWRVVSGVKTAVIGGGAKACLETASLVHPTTYVEKIPGYVEFSSEGEYPFKVRLRFNANKREVNIVIDFKIYDECFGVDCEEDKYKQLRTFIECLVKNRSGSLESCDPNGRVCKVRSFMESILCYAKNGFPEVYELKLENAIVK